ncbi:ubiquinone/menaquinone biosynthesis C-methylase UbiE [Natronospira proteinivora]|uniref:Ubiquinone/menaquinone biosynthesis C-methylase UbiE n=1 Tax=Natronospira proteinivora TaxID=1807133 RepID=A0ABT1G7E0_9GAMM|nr:methyltransferase domain-containing protein [Natronospira proteinivora]MCP1727215.1 ubiquinone/menaquinone biosynthesis C-methylase UbiE [Natronospira proteinivora]
MNKQPSAIREYDRLAPDYDRRWADYIRASLDATSQRLMMRSGETLLDVGCGTGLLLARLQAEVPGVALTGLDASSGMLVQARERLGESLALIQSPAEHLPFPDESFDGVVSSSAFHYFRQPQQAVNEMYRVLRPGGRLLITDWCRDYWTMRLLNRWLVFRDPAHYHTWRGRDLQGFLHQAGFEAIGLERYRISAFWGLMSAQARRGRVTGVA